MTSPRRVSVVEFLAEFGDFDFWGIGWMWDLEFEIWKLEIEH